MQTGGSRITHTDTDAALQARRQTAREHPELLLYLMTVTRVDRTGSIKGKEPLGHLTLASYLQMVGWDVRVFAGSIYTALTLLKSRKEADAGRKVLVGLYCDYENLNAIVSLAEKISQDPGYPILMGGPQAIALDEAFLQKHPFVTAFIRGDGEHSVSDILSAWARNVPGDLKKIPGVCTLTDGVYTDNGFSELLMNMDEGPSVRDTALIYQGKRTALAALSGRGCPFHCAFCYEGGNSKTVRLRSVPHMMAEIRQRLKDHPEAKYIYFGDDTFTLQPERLRAFCDALTELRKEHDFVWFADGHVRVILRHPEYLPMMIKAGMVRMQIGIESTVQSIIDLYQKNIKKEELYQVVDICLAAGLPQLAGNIIIGGAMETKESIEETFETIYDLIRRSRGMLDVSSTLYSHFPGTAMSRDTGKFGLIIEDPEGVTSFADYPIARTKDLSRDEIAALRRRFIVETGRVMKECVATGAVDESRILQHMHLKQNYGISSLWLDFGLTLIQSKYYYLKSMFGISWEAAKDPGQTIPVRSFFLHNAVGFVRSFPDIEGLPLAPVEAELLHWCAGKLTFCQIRDRLYETASQDFESKASFTAFLTDRLRYLEKKHLLVLTETDDRRWMKPCGNDSTDDKDRIMQADTVTNTTHLEKARNTPSEAASSEGRDRPERVLLFFPRTASIFAEESSAGTNIGIYILGAVLQQKGYRASACECSVSQIMDYVRAENDGTILAVGISVDYENRRLVPAVARSITELTGIPVILGGVDARTLTAEEISASGAVAVIKGEGELTLPKVADILRSARKDGHFHCPVTDTEDPDIADRLQDIPGLLLVRGGALVDTGEEEVPMDLDLLPFPDYSISLRPLKGKTFNILTSRGCPNHCAFCHEGTRKTKVRMRSISNVLAEVRSLLSAWPELSYIKFCDDTLVSSPERVRELCEGIRRINAERESARARDAIAGPEKLEWFCEADVFSLYRHPELVPMMVEAGMVRMQIGIESGDDAMLRLYEKNLSTDMTRQVIRQAFEAGLVSMAGPILVGAPFENPEHIEREKSWIRELIRLAPGMTEIPVSIISPYPQTRIGQEPERYGYIMTDAPGDGSNTDFPGYHTQFMTEKEILAGYQALSGAAVMAYRSVLEEGLVPEWRLKEAIRFYLKTGDGFYGRTVQRLMPYVFSCFQLALSCGVPSLKEVDRKELPRWHIQRTFEIWRFVNVSGPAPAIGSYVLSPYEYQVLLYCAGKLSLAEIADRMYENYAWGDSREAFLDRVIDTVLFFEKKYWVVGVPF